MSRLLYGSVQVQSFDVQSNIKDIHKGSNSHSFPFSLGKYFHSFSSSSFSATKNVEKAILTKCSTFSAPQSTILYPKLHNLHEFIALDEGAAILDVLLPPYDSDENRECNFYQVPSCESQISVGSTIELIKFDDQPYDFHCINGEFGCFGDKNDDDEDEGY